MANPFFVQPAQYGQALSGLAGSVQQFGQQRQEEQRRQEAEAYKQEAKQAMATAFQSGDPMAIRQAVIQYPEIAETATQMFGFTNEQTEKVARETYRRIFSEQDEARQAAILEGGIETVRQFGGNPRMMARDLALLKENQPAALKAMRGGYAALASDQEFEAMFPEASGPNIGQYNPRDYTTDSFAEFTRTGDPSVLKRFASQQSVDIGGVPHVFDPAIGGYRPASVSGAAPSGQPSQPGGQAPSVQPQAAPVTAETVAESRATITSAEERAKLDAALAKQGYRLGENDQLEPIPGGEPAREQAAAESAQREQKRQAFDKADTMLGKIDTALGQVDWKSAGAIGQVAQFLGGTSAKDLQTNIDTIVANLGFDALADMRAASPTGGALGQVTEKEIRFLQSLRESLAQEQSPEQLRQNLSRLREGVEKTRQILNGEIQAVETEDAIADLPDGARYIVADDPARRVRTKGAQKQRQAPQAAIQYLQNNPSMAEQFRQKYGYLPEGF